MADLTNKINATYKGKEEDLGKKALYLLNYIPTLDKTFRLVLNMHRSIRKILLHTQELWGCTASQLPLLFTGFDGIIILSLTLAWGLALQLKVNVTK